MSTTLTVATAARGVAGLRTPFSRDLRPVFALGLSSIGILLMPVTGRRKLRSVAFACCWFLPTIGVLMGCGGGITVQPVVGGTPAGKYSITVTATSGTTSHSQTVNLIVN